MKNQQASFLLLFIFFILSSASFSQVLHHQMFVAQGAKTSTSSGLIVSQSIGQQSIAGSYSSKTVSVQQGFQQFAMSKEILIIPDNKAITTIIYPNPFVNDINLRFSGEIKGMVDYKLMSMSGKLLLQDTKMAEQNRLAIGSLGYLPTGSYILMLSASNYKYSVTIIKK
jgi:hypothetical protein